MTVLTQLWIYCRTFFGHMKFESISYPYISTHPQESYIFVFGSNLKGKVFFRRGNTMCSTKNCPAFSDLRSLLIIYAVVE